MSIPNEALQKVSPFVERNEYRASFSVANSVFA